MMKVSFSRLKATFERSSTKGCQSCGGGGGGAGGLQLRQQRAQSMHSVHACGADAFSRQVELLSACGGCTAPNVRARSNSSRSINAIFSVKTHECAAKALDGKQSLPGQRSLLHVVRCKLAKRFRQPPAAAGAESLGGEAAECSWLPAPGSSEVSAVPSRAARTKTPALNAVHPSDGRPVPAAPRSPHGAPPLQRGSLYGSRAAPLHGAPCPPPRDASTVAPTPSLPAAERTAPSAGAAAAAPAGREETAPSAERSLAQELRTLLACGWYWGPISKLEAEARLSGLPDGAFLVRDSSDDRYVLSLSFRSCGSTRHTRIQHANGAYSFYVGGAEAADSSASIRQLIEAAVERSRRDVYCYTRDAGVGATVAGENGATRVMPVRLTTPLSRRTQVPTLQALCRFVIRQHVRLDLVRQLPLPDPIKAFVELNVL